MARMRTVDAVVQILCREGVTDLFGLPGAAPSTCRARTWVSRPSARIAA